MDLGKVRFDYALLCYVLQLNPGTIGVYRTQYSSDMLDSLIPAVSNMSLPARDRLGLQNDLFALVRC